MAVLVIAEHDNQVLKTSTLNTITAAQKINNEVHLIILGKDIQTLSDTSKSIHLLSKVLKCDNEKLENFLLLKKRFQKKSLRKLTQGYLF